MSLLLSSASSTPLSARGQSSPSVLVPMNANEAIALAVKLFGGQPVQEVLETPLAAEVREDLARILRGSSCGAEESDLGVGVGLTSPPDSPTKTSTQMLSPRKTTTKLGAAAAAAGMKQASTSPAKSKTSTLFSTSSTALSLPAKTSLSSPQKEKAGAGTGAGSGDELARRDVLAELEQDLSARLRLVDWAALQELPDVASEPALEYEFYEQEASTLAAMPEAAGGAAAAALEQQVPSAAATSGALSSSPALTRPEATATTTSMAVTLPHVVPGSPRRQLNDGQLMLQMLSSKREVPYERLYVCMSTRMLSLVSHTYTRSDSILMHGSKQPSFGVQISEQVRHMLQDRPSLRRQGLSPLNSGLPKKQHKAPQTAPQQQRGWRKFSSTVSINSASDQ